MCPQNIYTRNSFTTETDFQKVDAYVWQLWQENQSYKKMLFGKKSEKHIEEKGDMTQLYFDGLEEETSEIIEKEIDAYTRKVSKKKKPVRKPLPEHLSRKTEVLVPDEVKEHPEQYEKIGEEITEQLEMVPAKFYVNRQVRPTYKFKNTDKIITAELPPTLFPKFMAGGSVIAHILTAKYADHLPLYRIVKQFSRSNLFLNESTIVGWISHASNYLEILYNRLLEKIPLTKFIHGDETPIPVLEKGNSKTHQGYMFVYVLDKKSVIFDYRRGRGKGGPLEILKSYFGILLTDGYSGYNEIVRKNNLIHIGCMAHIRRKLKDAYNMGFHEVEPGILLIKKLYLIEETIKNSSMDERLRVRQEQSKPIYEELFIWANEKRKEFIPSRPERKAIQYFLNEHDKMKMYLEHPEADIDNNYVERTIRPLTIGRKNYLFAGSEQGAKRMAIIYSLFFNKYDIHA